MLEEAVSSIECMPAHLNISDKDEVVMGYY